MAKRSLLCFHSKFFLEANQKQNEAQSAHAESMHKGVNQHPKDITQTQ